MFDMRHMQSHMRHMMFDMRHMQSHMEHMMYDMRHLILHISELGGQKRYFQYRKCFIPISGIALTLKCAAWGQFFYEI